MERYFFQTWNEDPGPGEVYSQKCSPVRKIVTPIWGARLADPLCLAQGFRGRDQPEPEEPQVDEAPGNREKRLMSNNHQLNRDSKDSRKQ
jgi:hypothetical protein